MVIYAIKTLIDIVLRGIKQPVLRKEHARKELVVKHLLQKEMIDSMT